jgi:tRNA (adenine22-N1)-methyltransferase
VVASLVPEDSRVADVGSCDGGLSLGLLATGRAPWCVATERTPASGTALARIPSRGDLDVRYGDGLDVVMPDDAVDVVVMAGMGARTAVRILERAADRGLGFRRVVVQPQTETTLLRRWLVERGYGIVDERMAHDRGRFYVVVAAEPGAAPPRHPRLGLDTLLEAGPCLVETRPPLLKRYWQVERDRLARILEQAPEGPARDRAASRHTTATRVLAEFGPDSRPEGPGL